ncbi:hypothetical protein [Acidovorax sp.]|uniref:hypothetical protein n=1 Tax=Acidovorax sp. TaxID=1872122 RepID=UPI000BD77771|nr:hypothetical protein [Acidovorax sp.]OYW66325.1 MAG: hypothetical protein B7Z32_00585 [Hydrogenophilales bacterium 12-64-13]OYZ05879.1 MAG: hypothetical protein B7Y26_06035 [Hydrogenophilales bacterium 16-64-46]OZA39815.1 MAG: hypothetical protein B7X87_02060 [Hydrogenophilales bacterium 17-64-34]HQT00234.1 hypothetical protein [Thiobacillus sp.]
MRRLTLSLLLAWPLAACAGAPTLDPETGLATWQAEVRGVQVRLTQISPDQARAFYQARGFSAEAAERYAGECVFMTVVRNIGTTPIEHRLADWRYLQQGKRESIRSKADWDMLWMKLGVNEAARIAFNWAQFPATQIFAPGDWNQGMTSYRIGRGERFDLLFVWHTVGKTFSGTLHDVQCAPDAS